MDIDENFMASPRWSKHAANPVFGRGRGTCFDVSVNWETDPARPLSEACRLYFSWRPRRTVALACGPDGIRFGEPRLLLEPPRNPLYHYNRLDVLRTPGGWRMYVTYQYNPPQAEEAWSRILATDSTDGLVWDRPLREALAPAQPWEKRAVMCPSVVYDADAGLYKMWYSGGEQYEPDAIGYAESRDGWRWDRRPGPVLTPEPGSSWERAKVTACQVIKEDEGWRMFYVGFEDIDTARIGMAVSADGIAWKRAPGNPILSPAADGWERDACYKPYAIRTGTGWMLWYNGRTGPDEAICLATGPRSLA